MRRRKRTTVDVLTEDFTLSDAIQILVQAFVISRLDYCIALITVFLCSLSEKAFAVNQLGYIFQTVNKALTGFGVSANCRNFYYCHKYYLM